MSNIEKKSFNECSDITKRIITSVDRWIDGEKAPIIVYDVDPSVDEACDAVKFIIDTGWIGGIIYARKMVYIDHPFEKETFTTKMGLVITTSEKDFHELENNEHAYYKSIDSFPEIIGVPEVSNKDHLGSDGDIYLKQINRLSSYTSSKEEWEEVYDMDLKPNEQVLLYFGPKSLYNSKIEIGTYTGVKTMDSETSQIFYEIMLDDESKIMCPRGINHQGKRFVTLPEQNLIISNQLEANAKSIELFSKIHRFEDYQERRKNSL